MHERIYEFGRTTKGGKLLSLDDVVELYKQYEYLHFDKPQLTSSKGIESIKMIVTHYSAGSNMSNIVASAILGKHMPDAKYLYKFYNDTRNIMKDNNYKYVTVSTEYVQLIVKDSVTGDVLYDRFLPSNKIPKALEYR